MDLMSRSQYLKTLIQRHGYLLKSKKQKSLILDEYCKNTGQNRKYVIWQIRKGKYLQYTVPNKQKRRNRKEYYDNAVKLALIHCWEIFDYPCGQRLEPLLKQEVDRLRSLGELKCSEEVAIKLKKISFRTIDEKLKHQKEVEGLRKRYHKKNNPLLYQKIPIKLSTEWDRSQFGNIQIDLVEHCGQSTRGEYICTLSSNDIATGWWEGTAIMGRGQCRTFEALIWLKERYPFAWKEIHSDNGSEFINSHLFRYIQKEGLGFSRSRPNKKNDNCFVEQKNWTHVRKFVGYLRYDTQEELEILNDLYRNELRLYKNFFQPVIKLISKERVGGKIYRKYEGAKTPYQRVMESEEISAEIKKEIEKIYESLNPAQLKRDIEMKLDRLYKSYQKKNNSRKELEPQKKLKPISVRFLIAQPELISVR